MDKWYLMALITLDVMFLAGSYFAILNRLRYINKRHIKHTQVGGLLEFHKKLVKIISALFIILLMISLFIILTFV